MSIVTHKTIEQQETSKTLLGFWIYLMTDCLLFATLFATYAVLQGGTSGGPSGKDIFDLPFVFIETVLLLTSSFIGGLAVLAAGNGNKSQALFWLSATFALGLAFVGMELYEFNHLISEGHGWQTSGFLSAFFTLVATHGLHITIGLLWALVLGIKIFKQGLTTGHVRRLTLFGLFWHFLDVVWIFIFTIVYLMGVI